MTLSPALKALQTALASIPQGRISDTARRAGMQTSALLRLRRGEKMNVRAETLARLASAMGRTVDDLLGLTPPEPLANRVAVLEAALQAERDANRRLKAALRALPALAPDDEAPKPRTPKSAKA